MASGNPSTYLPVPVEGYRSDLMAMHMPPRACWDANNVLVHDGSLRPRPAHRRLGATGLTSRPLSITQWSSEVEHHAIVCATRSGWYHLNKATNIWSSITGNALHGGNSAQTVFRTFERGGITYLLGTNGVDAPKVWNGAAATYSDVQGGPPSARGMVISVNRVVLLGAGPDRLLVDTSAFNNFDAGWGTVQQTLLGDTPGEIVCGLEINNINHIIFKTDAIYRGIAQAEFFGTATPFRYEVVASDVPGPVAPNAVCRLPDGTMTYLGGDGGLYVFDGVRPMEMGRHIRHHVLKTWDYNKREEAFLAFDPYYKLLWVWYQHTAGGGTKGFVCATDQGVQGLGWPMWPVSLPATWTASCGAPIITDTVQTIGDLAGTTLGALTGSLGSLRTSTPRILFGISSGTMFYHDWSENAGVYKDENENPAGDPHSIPISFKTGLSDLGAADRWKTLHELEHTVQLQADETISLSLTMSDYGEEPTTSAAQSLTSTTDQRITQHRESARWFGMALSATIGRLFKWSGAVAFFRPRGRR